MNTLTRLLLAIAVASATALNVCAEKEGGPPGLQKKGGLPPGQAKKRGKSGEAGEEKTAAVTNAPAVSTSTKIPDAPKPPSPVPDAPAPPEVAKPGTPDAPKSPTQPQIAKSGPGQLAKPTGGIAKAPDSSTKPAPKLTKEAIAKRERLQKDIAELDTMAQKPEVRDRLMARLYKNTDVPLSVLEAQQKANPNVGMGGLYIANAIAKKSRQPADAILAEHKAGNDWASIASAHKVALSDLLESASGAKESARNAERAAAKR